MVLLRMEELPYAYQGFLELVHIYLSDSTHQIMMDFELNRDPYDHQVFEKVEELEH